MANRNRPVRSAMMILGLAMLLAACASDTSTLAGTPIALPAATTPSATTASPTSTPTGKITITAPKGATLGGYADTQLTASADTPIQIVFRNDDAGIMHNVQLFEGTTTTGTPLWAPPATPRSRAWTRPTISSRPWSAAPTRSTAFSTRRRCSAR